MRYKIKFRVQTDFLNLIEELDNSSLFLFSVNKKRRFIVVEELTHDMILKIKNLGGIVTDDYQYDSE